MRFRSIIILTYFFFVNPLCAYEVIDENAIKKTTNVLKESLTIAGDNSKELLKAISELHGERVESLVFLIKHMPERDLKNLSSEYLIENVNYAFKAREESEWAKSVPKDIFLNDVLPYASINERRDRWRKDFHTRFSPLVKKFKSLEEAAQGLNKEMWKMINVKYHARKRPKPDQSPYESIDAGFASCTGL